MERVDEKSKSKPIATGFLVSCGKYASLITCRHVAQMKNLWIRYSAKPSMPFTMVRAPIDSIEKFGVTWCFHPDPNIDLATRISYTPDDTDVFAIPISLFGDYDETVEGDDIFFMGFPLGITGETRVTPVVRSGIISLKKENHTYLIDANAFPGSSGSPVFLKPSMIDWKTMTLSKPTPPKLIGVVHSALTYTDYAISPQTKRPRITFEENAALAEVYSIEIIKQLLGSTEFNKQEKFTDKLLALPPVEQQIYEVQLSNLDQTRTFC